jgi:hypothetical protein
LKALFSRRFRDDLEREAARYGEISERLAGSFRERVAGQAREVMRRGGGDHLGPHGFPCRRTRPFPFYLYYQIQGESIYFLGLVHERRHPDFLKELMATARRQKPRD